MDRLGIEEGESIDSKMVTRAVENAQKKVESLHFESRKHILEYDDVANEQRKTVYKFRNELLDPNFDISEKIKQNRTEFIVNLLDQAEIFAGGLKSEFDLQKLSAIIAENGALISEDELKELDYGELVEKITAKFETDYEEKMSVLDKNQRKYIEKVLCLQVVDNAWREHLYQMDVLKTGIGLRGYNQKDPLTEYKKESFNLFMELVSRIKFETVKTLTAVRFRMEDVRDNSTEREPASVENSVSKKTARNDPCPCGSGKKFKDCLTKYLLFKYLRFDKTQPFIALSALLAFLGVGVGLTVLIVAMAIMNGFDKEFERKLFTMNYPISIVSGIRGGIDDSDVSDLEAKFPELKFSPYIMSQVIVKGTNGFEGGLLFGVNSVMEKQINSVGAAGLEERELEGYELLVGQGIKDEIMIGQSDKLTLIFTKNDPGGFALIPKMKRFEVKGAFNSGLVAYDKSYLYTSAEALRKILDYDEGRYDGIHVFSNDPFKDIAKISKELSLGQKAVGWWQQNGNFFSALALEKRALFIVLMLIILVASLNIVSSLLMTVMNRRQEIALLLSLGASQNEIKKSFFALGAAIVAVSSFYPAKKAAQINVLETLRNE